jgi:hypothetical protein
MTRPACLYLILALLIVGGIWAPRALGSEPKKVTLLANEEYVGAIDHENTRYLQVTLTNLAEEAATCRIAFYRERVELSADRVGPVEFRTFTLEAKNDKQTRIWSTLNFDEFTLNVETGNIEVIVVQGMTVR